MGTLFVGKWSRRVFGGVALIGLVWLAAGFALGRPGMLAVGAPLAVVGLFGLVLGRQRLDPWL